MNVPRRTFLHLAAGTDAVGPPARPVRIIVGAPSVPNHEKNRWGKPFLAPVAFLALPPLAVAFAINQHQPNF